ncbi:glycosyltransferase [Lysobacter sp. H23M47]|uniref:glycosyltransferase n=1 Tax=Lysobacter sp. H23M47 TaxID=2781024 RepID=UPI00187E5FFB|nr:glycosyltransferase [Lysobacter sp. H23M47]QOW24152.1 glycosyltransferase [Lysobacter sp. H23M47]
MRIVLWGTHDTGKPRTRILIAGLGAAGVDLEQIHTPVWEGIEDKSQLSGWPARVVTGLRWLMAYPALVWRLLRAPRPDLLLVGYPGIVDILIAAPIARVRGIPLAWDVFLSLYDTICEDRKLVPRGSLAARTLYRIERFALKRADVLFMDTRAHARRLEHLFDLSEGSCGAVWVGVEAERFPARPTRPFIDATAMQVLFYGQFIPLHGIETIIAAARLLREAPIRWQLIGHGQEAALIRRLLDDDPLPNLKWTEWVDYADLERRIAEADLCLGIFGTSEKAASVIPNKVFQIIAAQRPLVTRDSPAIRELLSPSPRCVRLIPAGDARALADAVLAQRQTMLDNSTPAGCHAAVLGKIDATAIGRQFLAMIQQKQSRQ